MQWGLEYRKFEWGTKAGSTLRKFHGRNVETVTLFCRNSFNSVAGFALKWNVTPLLGDFGGRVGFHCSTDRHYRNVGNANRTEEIK